MKQQKPKVVRRSEPDLPADVTGWDEAVYEAGSGRLTLEDCRGVDLALAGQELEEFRATGAVIEGASLAGMVARHGRWRDVRLVRCDLSNAVLRGLEMVRVEFVECRLLGLKAMDCRWQDVLVKDCDARYAQWCDGALKTCEFERSRLEEADLRRSNLEGALFTGCALDRADLSGAQLKGADLRGASLEGITVGRDDVQGAIVTAAQAVGLARLLGLEIR